LNTHDGASLYEAFSPAEARRILDKLDFHYTPKHGSWLNMAETEINIMNSQCLDRRLDNQPLIAAEVAAWEKRRNIARARIHWTFTLAAARRKLRKIYPSMAKCHQVPITLVPPHPDRSGVIWTRNRIPPWRSS